MAMSVEEEKEEDSALEEKKMAILSNDDTSQNNDASTTTTRPRKKGGLITMPFIIVNESFEKISSYGLMPNMIFYLMSVYHLEAAKGSIILSIWSAISNAMAIFGGFLSDSYLGRFRVIALGTFCSLLGTTLLWCTSMIPWMKPPPCARSSPNCESATPAQYLILFGSFGLISIGAGCVRPCSIAFGADQINNKENPKNERNLDSFFNWYYASTGLSTIIALTAIVYIQEKYGWPIGFGVPAILMILSLVAFLFGSPLYVHVKAKEKLFVGLLQVPIAAFRKRKISLPPLDSEEHYFRENGLLEASILTHRLRCLNRACVITEPSNELKPDGSATNPWRLCSVERVEILKSVLRILPMWTTGFMVLVALNNNYTTLQANTMDRHLTSNFQVPAATFHVFLVLTITLWVAFYDRVIVPLMSRFFGMPRGLTPKTRMGIGILLACIAMLVSGLVESIRRREAYKEGLAENPRGVLKMSAMWLVPQYVLLGLAEAINGVGQIEFFYAHLSKSMSSIAMAIYTLGMAIASLISSVLMEVVDASTGKGGKVSWLASNLNKGHVDYYYWLVAFLSFLNYLYFLWCCRLYSDDDESRVKKKSDIEEHDSV